MTLFDKKIAESRKTLGDALRKSIFHTEDFAVSCVIFDFHKPAHFTKKRTLFLLLNDGFAAFLHILSDFFLLCKHRLRSHIASTYRAFVCGSSSFRKQVCLGNSITTAFATDKLGFCTLKMRSKELLLQSMVELILFDFCVFL